MAFPRISLPEPIGPLRGGVQANPQLGPFRWSVPSWSATSNEKSNGLRMKQEPS